MSATHSLPVSEQLYRDVSQRADSTGVSPSEWAEAVLAERLHVERQTDEYFQRRAIGASSKSLGELLDKAPNRPPDRADGFDD